MSQANLARSPMDLFALVHSFDYPNKLLVPHGRVYGPIRIQKFGEKKWAVTWGAMLLGEDGSWHFFEHGEFHSDDVYMESYHEAFARADRFAE